MVFANIRWEVALALLLACIVLIVVGLLGLLTIVGDIAWTILSFARANRAGESQLKF
jgi:hypothetical protein